MMMDPRSVSEAVRGAMSGIAVEERAERRKVDRRADDVVASRMHKKNNGIRRGVGVTG